MYTISLKDSALDFKTLEQKIYKTVCEVACDVLKNILEELLYFLRGDQHCRKKSLSQLVPMIALTAAALMFMSAAIK